MHCLHYTVHTMKSTALTLIVIILECAHSMFNTVIGLPIMALSKALSERIYDGDKSLLMTRIEIISGVVTFLISLYFVLQKYWKSKGGDDDDATAAKSTLRYKTRLLFLPTLGGFVSLTTLLYAKHNEHDLSVPTIYALFSLPSLTGLTFLFEICMSDIIAGIVLDKRRRVSLFLWVKGGKMVGICFVQIILPLANIEERYMTTVVCPIICCFLLIVNITLVVIETYMNVDDENVTVYLKSIKFNGEFDDNDSPIDNVHLRKNYNDDNEDGIVCVETTSLPKDEPKYPILLKTILCLLIMMHSAQRGEYKFTYIFMSVRLEFESRELRIINGCQYMLFMISLYSMGYLIRKTKHAQSTLIAFAVSMLFSTAARVCQIVAWDITNFKVWCLSALLSTPGPLAYQVMQQVMYKTFENEQWAGIVLMTVDKFLSLPFTQLYQVAYANWNISPFYVTLFLMVATTLGGLTTKTMRKLINS